MKRSLPILFGLLSVGAFAQSVTISKIEVAGDKIIVYYNLENSNPASNFLLNLYESKDNFSTPLARVTGDVGSEVKPGANKKIEWNIRQEYGNYKGKLSLELRGKVYVPFVKLQNYAVASSYKRGKSHDIVWQPGNADPINIELYKGTERIQGSMNQPNNGAYVLNIASNAKKGSDYRLKFSSTKNNDEVIYSSNFKVTPKIPTLLKVLPVLVVGGAVVALSGGSKGGDNGGNNNNSGGDIPTPSLPPGG
jgi:hypothetical protein